MTAISIACVVILCLIYWRMMYRMQYYYLDGRAGQAEHKLRELDELGEKREKGKEKVHA